MKIADRIRAATPGDFPALHALAVRAIGGPRTAYGPVETAAWLERFPGLEEWSTKLSCQQVFVAHHRSSRAMPGFMTLTCDGLIDFAFIDPDYQAKGLFRHLFRSLETSARDAGMPMLEAKASRNAIGPFEAQGFRQIAQEIVQVGDVELERFHVRKKL